MAALLRQLEFQASLAAARGLQGIDVTWLRAELVAFADRQHIAGPGAAESRDAWPDIG